jgi:hypothetical protein
MLWYRYHRVAVTDMLDSTTAGMPTFAPSSMAMDVPNVWELVVVMVLVEVFAWPLMNSKGMSPKPASLGFLYVADPSETESTPLCKFHISATLFYNAVLDVDLRLILIHLVDALREIHANDLGFDDGAGEEDETKAIDKTASASVSPDEQTTSKVLGLADVIANIRLDRKLLACNVHGNATHGIAVAPVVGRHMDIGYQIPIVPVLLVYVIPVSVVAFGVGVVAVNGTFGAIGEGELERLDVPFGGLHLYVSHVDTFVPLGVTKGDIVLGSAVNLR